MPIFFHDQFLFGDETAFAQYRQEHWLEHIQFVQIGQAQTPTPVLIPDYDLTSWDKRQSFVRNWLVTHEDVHEVLRSVTGVSGINLADVDLDNETEFYTWTDAHRDEHALLRRAFGIMI
jgi:hypothetical protein